MESDQYPDQPVRTQQERGSFNGGMEDKDTTVTQQIKEENMNIDKEDKCSNMFFDEIGTSQISQIIKEAPAPGITKELVMESDQYPDQPVRTQQEQGLFNGEMEDKDTTQQIKEENMNIDKEDKCSNMFFDEIGTSQISQIIKEAPAPGITKELVECKGCRKQLKSLLRHLSSMPQCRLQYDMGSLDDQAEAALKTEFAECNGCHEQFRSLLSHLRKRPQCQSQYDMELLKRQQKAAYTNKARLKYHSVKKLKNKSFEYGDYRSSGSDYYNSIDPNSIDPSEMVKVTMNEVDRHAFHQLDDISKSYKAEPLIVGQKQNSGIIEESDLGYEVRMNDMDRDASHLPDDDQKSNEEESLTVECDIGIDVSMNSEDEDASHTTDDIPKSNEGESVNVECDVGVDVSMTSMDQNALLPPGMLFPPGLFFNSNEDSPFVGVPVQALYTRTLSDSGKDFSCNVCYKTFKGKRDCIRHVRSHTKEKPFTCKLCGKSFGRECYLRMHEKIHSGEKPFMCSMCKQEFARKATLEQHMLTHSDIKERPFQCHLCSNGYVKSSHLDRHIRTHLQIHEFFCTICHQSFLEKRGLVSHMKRLHSGERPFPCSICRQEFRKEYILRKHMLSVHDYDLPKQPKQPIQPIPSHTNPPIKAPEYHSLFGNTPNFNNNLGLINNAEISHNSGALENSADEELSTLHPNFFQSFIQKIDKNINKPHTLIQMPKIENNDEVSNNHGSLETSTDVSDIIKKEPLTSYSDLHQSTIESFNSIDSRKESQNMVNSAEVYSHAESSGIAVSPNESKKMENTAKKEQLKSYNVLHQSTIKSFNSIDKRNESQNMVNTDKVYNHAESSGIAVSPNESKKIINTAKKEQFKSYNDLHQLTIKSFNSIDRRNEIQDMVNTAKLYNHAENFGSGGSPNESKNMVNTAKVYNYPESFGSVVSPKESQNAVGTAKVYNYSESFGSVVISKESQNEVGTAKVYNHPESFGSAVTVNKSQNVVGTAKVHNHIESFGSVLGPKESQNKVGPDEVYHYPESFGSAVSPNESQNEGDTAKVYNYSKSFGTAVSPKESQNERDTAKVYNSTESFGSPVKPNESQNERDTVKVYNSTENFGSAVRPNESQNEGDTAKVYNYSESFGRAVSPNESQNEVGTAKLYNYAESFDRVISPNESQDKVGIARVYNYAESLENSADDTGTSSELSSVSNILTMCLGNVNQNFQYLDN